MSPALSDLIPDSDDLIAMPTEELALIMLKVAASKMQAAGVTYQAVTEITIGTGMAAYRESPYAPHRKTQVDDRQSRAWNWLERKGLLEPASGMNGQNGWRVLTDEGRKIVDNGKDLSTVLAGLDFPKSLIHPAIRDRVWSALQRGEFDAVSCTRFC